MPKESEMVSIVILNYNGQRFIPRLLETLCDQSYKNFEVVFVDNASTDCSMSVVRALLEKEPYQRLNFKIIQSGTNLGFCGGNNLGSRSAVGDYIVFLNNDTYLSSTWLQELVSVIGCHKQIGACQSRVVSAFTDEVETDGFNLDIGGQSQTVVFNGGEGAVLGRAFYVSGASMILRRPVFADCGGFDQSLFFGDYDLCWRLRLFGYDVATALESRCYHYGSSTIRATVSFAELTFHSYREIIRVLLKNCGRVNLLKRMLQLLPFITISSIHLSITRRSSLSIFFLIKSLLWNLRNIKDTLNARRRVQAQRRVSDDEIGRHILHYYATICRRGRVLISVS
ncbi:glycosyltransferase family 2 protein [Candidatus Bathyarchaeota archaeon]|nr:glycosyltransferase family 2 protein [Candidatus Bathyarchaeota archaeon]